MIKHERGYLYRLPTGVDDSVIFPAGIQGCVNAECDFASDCVNDFGLYVLDESCSEAFNVFRDTKEGMFIWPLCKVCVAVLDNVTMN